MVSLEEKVGQKLLAGFHGLEPPDYILEWLAEGRIGGVILFARNVDTPDQLAKLTKACHDAARTPILIGIDQEGGIVARLRQGFTESPGAMVLGVSDSEALAEEVSFVLAAELKALGINWNYAPVVDITHNVDNPSVGTRSIGTDKERVSRLTVAEVRGFQKAGVAATAKHFPGLGNTSVDTHEALAVIDDSVEYLWENDLVPFRRVVDAGVASVMITHVKFSVLDNEYPATMSPVIISKLLREEIGFDGIVSTDCMEMKAITDHYGPGESAVLAAQAGVDLILFSHTRAYQEEVYEALLAAHRSGRISEDNLNQSYSRIQAFKTRFPAKVADDVSITIANPAHLGLMRQVARSGTVLVRPHPDLLPLPYPARKVGLVEFAALLDWDIMDQGRQSGFVSLFSDRYPDIPCISLKSSDTNPQHWQDAQQLAKNVDVLVLVTRNAHIIKSQLEMARTLLQDNREVVLVCLRNPFDVDVLSGASAVLCTCGDARPSLQAAVDALSGEFTPQGVLSVPLQSIDT